MLYYVKWLTFAVSMLLHRLYQLVVFISKPGARLIPAYIAHAITLYVHVTHQGLPDYDITFTAWEPWYDTTVEWLTYDATARGSLASWDIALLLIALALHLTSTWLLRETLGLFPAKKRPLPPMKPLKAQTLKIKAARVRIKAKRLRRPWRMFPYKTTKSLPNDIQRILS